MMPSYAAGGVHLSRWEVIGKSGVTKSTVHRPQWLFDLALSTGTRKVKLTL
jgi:hypothetical protein